MKPEDYFQPGSVPFIQAQEAISVINAAKAAGLPEAEQYEKSFMSSLDIVRKNNDWSGFDANRQAISGLAPQIQAVAKEKNEISSLGSQIDSTITLFESSGGKLTKEQSAAIAAAKEQGNKAALNTYNDLFGKQTAALIERQLPMSAADQAKADTSQKEKELKDISAIDQSSQFINILDKLEKHEGFSNLFGSNIGVPTWWAGSAGADARAILDQIDSKAFMESIKSLKGMGALSDAEGRKASSAFISLKPSMSQDAAKEAISEAKSIIQKGINNSKRILAGEKITLDDSSTPIEDKPENQVKAINNWLKQNSTTK